MSSYQCLRFAANALSDSSLEWGAGGRLALCSEDAVIILTPEINPARGAPVKMQISRILAPEAINDPDLQIDRGFQGRPGKQECIVCLMMTGIGSE